MGEKIVIGPINKGLSKYYTPFYIDNDSFPVLVNAYQWRGRIKRKRGTSLLNRLERYFNSNKSSYIPGATPATITLNASGYGNIISGPYSTSDMTPVVFALQTNSSIIPGTVTLQDTTTSVSYTDLSKNGTLSPSGTINYATGEVFIAAAAGHSLTVVMNYYPELPVMGLEDLILNANTFPGNLAFDTQYAYNMLASAPYTIYDVSFYKNPPTSSPYTHKTAVTPISWNGQNYQQFYIVNYAGAFWATNGITDPFTTTNIGMQFAGGASGSTITYGSVTTGPPATITLTITNCPLVIGDFVFLNEWTGTNAATLNFQSGYVTSVFGTYASLTITVTLPNATLGAGPYSPGIVQYLTNRSDVTKDCIRWYDGDPTNGIPFNPTLNGNLGWVNFMPPLLSGPTTTFSISDLPPAQYYLVGARIITVYKDRLLFFGPVVQTSTGVPIYLQDTVIYSQNGTPYYTASFTGSTTLPTTQYSPILVPVNQTATANAWFEDVTGYGGFETAGFASPITSVSTNEDVLIVGFTNRQARFVYTGNDIVPFNFFVTNSELGTYSTFSTITFDRGVNSIGSHGIITSQQIGAQRIDLDIPDQVFQFNLTNNGTERICAARDFINEWIYWTYSVNTISTNNSIFPNQTLQYNYRDNTWAIFNETYTTYGQFREITGETWATIGEVYPTWREWEVPWNAGASTLEQSKVIAGNQQGFVFLRDQGTAEDGSLAITNIKNTVTITGVTQANPAVITANNSFVVGEMITINGVVGMTQLNGNSYMITAVTPSTITINVNSTGYSAYISGGTATSLSIYSPNHCLNEGDYIIINGVLGPVGSQVNGNIYSVQNVSINSFDLNPAIVGGVYLGGGTITRMYVPFFQTKQFPTSWGMSRKTRIGAQQYCFTGTESGQIELQIYLSQNASNPYNLGPIVPTVNSQNNALIYNDIIFTSPENYIQICNNIPLGNIGNGTTTTITLNFFQLFKFSSSIVPSTVVITIGTVATFTDNGNGGFNVTGTGVSSGSSIFYSTGLVTLVFSSAPTSQPSSVNFSYYYDNIQSPTADQQQQIWHRMNTSLLGDTVQLGFTMSDAQMRGVDINGQPLAQFEEIELHSIILDVQPSQVLA
jgi:hypothetical protein